MGAIWAAAQSDDASSLHFLELFTHDVLDYRVNTVGVNVEVGIANVNGTLGNSGIAEFGWRGCPVVGIVWGRGGVGGLEIGLPFWECSIPKVQWLGPIQWMGRGVVGRLDESEWGTATWYTPTEWIWSFLQYPMTQWKWIMMGCVEQLTTLTVNRSWGLSVTMQLTRQIPSKCSMVGDQNILCFTLGVTGVIGGMHWI